MGQTPKQELSVEEAREIYVAAIDHMTAVIHEDVATIVAAVAAGLVGLVVGGVKECRK